MNKLRFDRSSNYPDGTHSISFEGKDITYREAYSKPGRYHRADIFMVNAHCGQFCVEPSPDGKPHFGRAYEYMTPSEIVWCFKENARMLRKAAKYPEYKRAMRL